LSKKTIKSHLKSLGQLREKRSQQYFKLLEKEPTLVKHMVEAYAQSI